MGGAVVLFPPLEVPGGALATAPLENTKLKGNKFKK